MPPEWEDVEFLEQGLVLALARYQADPALGDLCTQWAAELAALQEIRGGRNDCG